MQGFSEICISQKCITVMEFEKTSYQRPETSVLDVRMEAFICLSNQMKFGSGNSSGSIEDENIVNGGDF